MAANTALTTARSSLTMAGLVLPAAFVPSPASNFPANYRPNKAELEARLSHAYIRAHNRRMRQSLGLGLPTNHNQNMAPRTTRAAAFSIPNIPRTLPIPNSAGPEPHITTTATTIADSNALYTECPHNLPTPPPSPIIRPTLPRLCGLGITLPLDDTLVEVHDAILTPAHAFPATLRRTPGAPLSNKQNTSESGSSYFHLPANLLTPALPAPSTIGLGIMGVDLGELDSQADVAQYFPNM